MTTPRKKSVYETLRAIKVSPFIKEKPGQKFTPKYIPWQIAWDQVKKRYPNMQRHVHDNEATGNNYYDDGYTAWVRVSVEIEGQTETTDLPIMYQPRGGQMQSLPLDKVTSFDVNSSIQRCTVKCLRLHGFGIDLVEQWEEDYAERPKSPARKKAKKEKINLHPEDSDYWTRAMGWAVPQAKKGVDNESIISELSRKYAIKKGVAKVICEILDGIRSEEAEEETKKETKVQSTAPKSGKKVRLAVGDENWESVVEFATKNSDIGIMNIIRELRKKYTVSQGVQLAIKDIITPSK